MKRLIISVMLIAFAFGAHAQTTAQSQSGSSATSQQQASVTGNTGNSLTLDTNSTAEGAAHYTGTARILSNPGVSLGGASAGFSNNNCANTMQGGLSGLRASVGIAAPKESRACNYRQNAATFYAAAGVRAANGQSARAEALMAMADEQACRAAAELDETDMDNCKVLGLVGGRESAKAFSPSAVISRPPPHPVKPVQKGDFPVSETETKQEKIAVIAVAHP
jgi:hypothetical protein